jgi:hypothetical protein
VSSEAGCRWRLDFSEYGVALAGEASPRHDLDALERERKRRAEGSGGNDDV